MRLEKSRSGMHHMDGRLTAQKASILKMKLAAGRRPERSPAAVSDAAAVAIDYPQSGESVVSREYTIRISARAPDGVEISIDGEAWRPCRAAAGYWWHDWSGYHAGPHRVIARIRPHKGRSFPSARRDFAVDL